VGILSTDFVAPLHPYLSEGGASIFLVGSFTEAPDLFAKRPHHKKMIFCFVFISFCFCGLFWGFCFFLFVGYFLTETSKTRGRPPREMGLARKKDLASEAADAPT
jgi:hypothetical protein